MPRNILVISFLCLFLAPSESPARAGTVPYSGTGSENQAAYSFLATSTGDLNAYFFGSTAAFDEQLGLMVNGRDTGALVFDDHSTAAGTRFDFGRVSAGDQLTFYINVNDSITGKINKYYSDPLLNSDHTQHVYSTAYAGGADKGATIPAGTYVAFEDLSAVKDGFSDYNYMDEQFVFTNTSASSSDSSVVMNAGNINGSIGIATGFAPSVPELSTWAMMLLGFAGCATGRYRVRSARIASSETK